MLAVAYPAALLGVLLILSDVAQAAPAVDRSQHPRLIERQVVAGDPCAALRGLSGSYFSPRTVHDCLQTIPLYQSTKDNILAAAESMSSMDVFAANQLGDDEPALHQGVDIQAEFQRIRATTYSSDYAFQRDLSRTMASLNDAHQKWVSCYDRFFSTTHALPIVALADDPRSPTANVYIVPEVEQYIQAREFQDIYSSWGIDGKELAGAQVLQMNGKPVWDYLEQDVLPHSGAFTDKQQRMNSLFAGYEGTQGGTFNRQLGMFTSSYDMTCHNITLMVQTEAGQQKTITLPWITTWDEGHDWTYNNGQAFWDAVCNAPWKDNDGSSNHAQISKRAEGEMLNAETAPPLKTDSGSAFRVYAAEKYRSCPIDNDNVQYPYRSSNDPRRSANYLGGRDVQFYQLSDRKSGVVYMPTFAPQPPADQPPDSLECFFRYYVDLVLGISNLTKAGVENILIDTSNNGGGIVSLSQLAQRLFTGADLLTVNNFETVFRKSPLTEAFHRHYIDNPNLSQEDFFAPGYWRPAHGTELLGRGDNIFEPGETFRINGRNFATSNRLSDPLSLIQTFDEVFGIPGKPPFAPDKIIFTGNGLCGSACAAFTNFMIEYYNATAYINAAQPNHPIEFVAFGAGQATLSSVIYAQADGAGFRNDKLMPRLKHAGEFGFALRAGISPRIAPDTFLQYRSYPAQNTFALTREMWDSPVKMWEYIAGQAF